MAPCPRSTEEVIWTAATFSSIMTSTVLPLFGAATFALGLAKFPSAVLMIVGILLPTTVFTLLSGTVPSASLLCARWFPSYSILPGTTVPAEAWYMCTTWVVTYLLSVWLVVRAIELGGAPSLVEFAATFVETFAIVGGCMSVCLHRYFSHQAFKTGRAMQALLCVGGCCAFQGSPVWWASKHRRHHKHCDTPDDPHSWKQTNYVYAWVGWTVNPKEQAVDEEYMGNLASFPELRLIGGVWWLWPLLIACYVHQAFGFRAMVLYATMPMFMARIVTLVFNVEYHPPDHPSLLEAKDGTRDGKAPACCSLDMARVLADAVGESCHDDHHAHPKRAKRPSGGFPYVDLPYWLVIKPLLISGLAWSPVY